MLVSYPDLPQGAGDELARKLADQIVDYFNGPDVDTRQKFANGLISFEEFNASRQSRACPWLATNLPQETIRIVDDDLIIVCRSLCQGELPPNLDKFNVDEASNAGSTFYLYLRVVAIINGKSFFTVNIRWLIKESFENTIGKVS